MFLSGSLESIVAQGCGNGSVRMTGNLQCFIPNGNIFSQVGTGGKEIFLIQ
jgi:hypothetical protein